MIFMGPDYRMKVDPDFDFARNALLITIVKRAENGFVPVTIEIKEHELVPVPSNTAISDSDTIPSVIDRDFAEAFLSVLANGLLGAGGDLVREHHRLKNELTRANRQLEKLIDGIGRLGGNNERT